MLLDTMEMPDWLDRRHAELGRAARECYSLRNAATSPCEAADFEAVGDVYFMRQLAVSAEFEA